MASLRNYVLGSPALSNTALGVDTTTSNFSATVWYQALDETGGDIWSQVNSTNTNRDGIAFGIQTATKRRPYLQIENATGNATIVGQAGWLKAGRWTHLGYVFTGGQGIFYQDGELSSGGSTSPITTPTTNGTRSCQVGGANFIGPLRGSIYDLRIFPNRALNPAEVRATMDPRIVIDGCKQRLVLSNWYDGKSSTAPVYDHSGTTNFLNMGTTANTLNGAPFSEPPWRSRLGVDRIAGIRRKQLHGTIVAAAVVRAGAQWVPLTEGMIGGGSGGAQFVFGAM